MKGKLYKYNPEIDDFEEIGHGEVEITLPDLEEVKKQVISSAKFINQEMDMQMAPREVLERAFDLAEEQAESLDRRSCIERQEIIQQMRDHFLNGND